VKSQIAKTIGEPTSKGLAENRAQSLLTCGQVGQSLGLCSATVKNWIKIGKIKAIRFNQRVIRVEESELVRLQREAVLA